MSNQPCPTSLICDCEISPLRNFSSERPDPADFFAFAYFLNDPPLNNPVVDFTNPIGIGGCYSVVSQVDANDCALRISQEDVWDPWRKPDGSHVPIFGNTEQTCHFPCPNGAPDSVFTIAAGTVIAHSQAEADAIAASLCQYRGQRAINCTNPVVPPSIEVVDLDEFDDIAPTMGFVVGRTGGQAGWFNNGGITLPAGAVSGTAFAVNDNGEVAGRFQNGGNQDGFWYDGILRDLGPGVSGNCISYGMSSNGFSVFFDPGPPAQSSLYNPITSILTNLGFMGGGNNTSPGVIAGVAGNVQLPHRLVVNSSGQITGTCRDGVGDFRAFRWSGALADITPPAASANPQASGLVIDDSGAVAGIYIRGTPPTNQRVFLNTGGGAANSLDIGGNGTRTTVIQSMSRQNRIICGVCDDGTPNDRAFWWSSTAGFNLIDRIAGAIAFPNMDCNSFGDIVGSDANPFGWIFRGGTVYKLIDILNAWATDPLWTTIDTAELCNDSRQIAGFGTYSGGTRGYLLTLPAGTETGPPPP